jgi:hypothetical protein
VGGLATVSRGAVLAIAIPLALLLAWACANVNMARSCATDDTPYLDLCPVEDTKAPAHIDALRARIARNPGDSSAYVQLALDDRSAQRPNFVAAAALVAPNDPNVLLIRASSALERADWPTAVKALIDLTDVRDNPNASLVLARLIAAGHGSLMAPYLVPGSQWLQRALAQMPQQTAAFSAAVPLVAQALKAGILKPEDIRPYVRGLKSAGAWIDAFSLWLSLHKGPIPILYNGSFDQGFDPDGFDWEINASAPLRRAGAVIDRRGGENRGGILDIQFTGRALAVPLVRQYLFVGPGRYKLRGEYRAHQFRMEQGLAWTVQCTSGGASAGRSRALIDTSGIWQAFEFDFTVPRGCGAVASLQLETFAPFEAALGARGRVAFDAFVLEKIDQM